MNLDTMKPSLLSVIIPITERLKYSETLHSVHVFGDH